MNSTPSRAATGAANAAANLAQTHVISSLANENSGLYAPFKIIGLAPIQNNNWNDEFGSVQFCQYLPILVVI